MSKQIKFTPRQIAANIRAIELAAHAPAYDGKFQHERVVAANDSLFTQAYFSEPLTAYATGWRDPNDLEAELEFYAPRVAVPRRFEYARFANAEEFFSDSALDDDLRALRGDFKEVEHTSEKVNAKTENRGLMICVDLDEVGDTANWRENYTGKLMRRLLRNSLRRSVALVSAGAVNKAKTWDTTEGKDPDQDVIAELILCADSSGIHPNRVGYGHTAWSKRGLAHRAQNTAGGFASAGMTEAALAGLLGVDKVMVSKSRFQSAAAAKTQIVGNLVLMFFGTEGVDTEDPSNVKRFVSEVEGGGFFRVFEQQVNAKKYTITVEHYEKTVLTTPLGLRKVTVS